MIKITLKYSHCVLHDIKCADCGRTGLVAWATSLPEYGIWINWDDYGDPNKSGQYLFCCECAEKRIQKHELEDSDKGGKCL